MRLHTFLNLILFATTNTMGTPKRSFIFLYFNCRRISVVDDSGVVRGARIITHDVCTCQYATSFLLLIISHIRSTTADAPSLSSNSMNYVKFLVFV